MTLESQVFDALVRIGLRQGWIRGQEDVDIEQSRKTSVSIIACDSSGNVLHRVPVAEVESEIERRSLEVARVDHIREAQKMRVGLQEHSATVKFVRGFVDVAKILFTSIVALGALIQLIIIPFLAPVIVAVSGLALALIWFGFAGIEMLADIAVDVRAIRLRGDRQGGAGNP